MTRHDQIQSPATWLVDEDLKAAARCLVAGWFASLRHFGGQASEILRPAAFGMLEPYLAEAAVIESGADFQFLEWGSAMSVLCGGNRLGQMLSTLPQPSRSHLRRVCVRAAASRSPALSRATWVLDGNIWRCTILALPTNGDDLTVKRLLVALLFAPHPIFASDGVPEGFGWPAAVPRGGVHGIRSVESAARSPRPVSWRTAASAVRRLLVRSETR
jgi:hypothetical protein